MSAAKKKKKEPVFNQRKRKIFRNGIPVSEAIFGAIFVCFVVAMGVWFFAQEDAYDPSERDISMEILLEDVVEDNLWHTPLQRWTDPGAMGVGGAAAVIDTGIFPTEILDGGWQLSSRLQSFDESTLYEKINGGADQFFQYGFNVMHYVSLEDAASGLEMIVELYDMTNFRNAMGIFAAQRGSDETVVQEGDAYFYLTQAGAMGIRDNYYFKLSGSENSEAAQNKAKQLLASFEELPAEANATDPIFVAFREALGVPFESIAFEKTDVFQFEFAKDFWFATVDKEQGMRLYAHEAATEDEAAELFNKLVDQNLPDYDLVERDEHQAILKHKFLGEYLITYYDGTLVAGVDGAKDIESADKPLDDLLGAIAYEQQEA